MKRQLDNKKRSNAKMIVHEKESKQRAKRLMCKRAMQLEKRMQ